jgi:hypothetical protein
MALRRRLAEWWRGKAEDREAIAQAEQEPLRAGDDPEQSRADEAQDVIDLGTGGGAT